MTTMVETKWEAKRTAETRGVEDLLQKAGFERVDAYRYNSASIRVRVVDSRFEGLSAEQRDSLVEPHLATLPERTQADILNLLTVSPSEISMGPKFREFGLLIEFEDPSPSVL